MRLVLIHGRSQQGKSELEIQEYWLDGKLRRPAGENTQGGPGGLKLAFTCANQSFPNWKDVAVPFYGDILINMMSQREQAVRVLRRGNDADGEQVDPLVSEIVLTMKERAGISDAEVVEVMAEENKVVTERGLREWKWVQAVAATLDRRIPWLANGVLNREVADVQAYVNRADIQQAVHAIVQPHLEKGPCIVIAHSLGTLVAYWLLAKFLPHAQIPLLITAGSPLGIHSIRNRLPGPCDFAVGVERWINLTDKRDIVALTESLDDSFFPGRHIENWTDFHNGNSHNNDDPHDIAQYLADPRVAQIILKCIK